MAEGLELRVNLILRFVGVIEGLQQKKDMGIIAFWNNLLGCNRMGLKLKPEPARKNVL